MELHLLIEQLDHFDLEVPVVEPLMVLPIVPLIESLPSVGGQSLFDPRTLPKRNSNELGI